MSGECGQALLDALLISDVCENVGEYGKLRTVKGGNVKSCLTHEAEQTHGFKRNCLTTCVWSGYYQKMIVAAQFYADGNDLLRIQKRMAGVSQIDTLIFIKDRSITFDGIGVTSLGEDKVKGGEHL